MLFNASRGLSFSPQVCGCMSVSLSKERKAEVIFSIRRFFSEELELVLSELPSGFLVDYFRPKSLPSATIRV
jgi:hypothetical protein